MTISALFDLSRDWDVEPLGVLCNEGGGDIQTGPFGSQLHAADYVPVGVPSIMPQNIGENRVNDDGIARIAADDATRLSRYLVRQGDIVYSRRGDVERRALIREAEDGWLCGTGCLRIRPGNGRVNAVYLSYYLAHSAVRSWIVRHAIGATMPNLNTSILSALPVVVPPLEEQRAIASVLGALDDKIDLNRRMNETLEVMARALFKSWFVDFDPVRAKAGGEQPWGMDAATAALFPDAFEDSDLGEIPQGWRAATIGDIADNRRDGANPDDLDRDTPYIGLEHMPRGSIALHQWETVEKVGSTKLAFSAGDILFGKLRPYFKKVGVAVVDGVCSSDILVVQPKSPDWFGVTVMQLSAQEFIDYTDSMSSGTKMPRVNWQDIARYPLALPDKNVALAFDGLVRPCIERIRMNIMESRTLAEMRDTLLPKLLSGEVRVGAAANVMGVAT